MLKLPGTFYRMKKYCLHFEYYSVDTALLLSQLWTRSSWMLPFFTFGVECKWPKLNLVFWEWIKCEHSANFTNCVTSGVSFKGHVCTCNYVTAALVTASAPQNNSYSNSTEHVLNARRRKIIIRFLKWHKFKCCGQFFYKI